MSATVATHLPRKTTRRCTIIDGLVVALKSKDLYEVLNYRQKSESSIKQYMHQIVKSALVDIHRELDPRLLDTTLRRKADDSLHWEGDVRKTINHVRFLGVQHRPDFKITIDGLRIAVEVKRGENGAAVREGIGQGLVYAASEDYDFVVYLFVDTSADKKVLESLRKGPERALVESLWENYNVRFEVV